MKITVVLPNGETKLREYDHAITPLDLVNEFHDSFEHDPISCLYRNDDKQPFVYLFPSGAAEDFPLGHRIL